MARIQEYMPEESASSPREAMSPNTEALGSAGRGLEKAGAGLEAGATAMYQRASQMETGQAFGDVSSRKVQDLQDQIQSTQDGTWDNDQYKNKFKEWQNEQVGKYETAAGKNTFMRQSDRALGTILTRGLKAQAQVAANNAVAQYTSNINDLATSSRLAPDTFEDNLAAAYEHSQDLPEAAREKADLHAENEIAKETLKGVADLDPDKAMEMLKDQDFVAYLNPKDYDSLHTTVKALQKENAREESVKDNLAKKASAAAVEKYAMNIMPDIVSGKARIKDVILNAPSEVSFADRKKLADSIHDMQKMSQETSPAILEGIRHRMLLPAGDSKAITSVTQLYGIKGLSMQDANKLSAEYIKTPMGHSEKAEEKGLYDAIKGKLKIPITGMADTDHAILVSNAMDQYRKEKDKIIKEGGDPSVLRDPTSKDYFLNKVKKRSLTEIIQMQTQAAAGKSEETPIVYTSPGVTPQEAKADEVERKSGSRIAVYDAKTKVFKRWK